MIKLKKHDVIKPSRYESLLFANGSVIMDEWDDSDPESGVSTSKVMVRREISFVDVSWIQKEKKL